MKTKPFFKAIRDAVHGNIVFEQKIFIDLINTSEFQRLHKISQLGGTFIAFPTANHTRFSHSLGTYFVTREIIKNIKNNNLNDYQQTVVMIAALLHDIGHGPFSHAFELMYPISHEEHSVKIISGNTEINQILNRFSPQLAKDVANVISKKHNNKIMVQLVSSQLDADRLDYLKRDSFFTGVSYSKVDLFWLIKNMEIINDQIVFNYKAVMNIEQYLLSRFNMFQSVYLYDACNAYELMIKNIIDRLRYLSRKKYSFTTNINLIKGLLKTNPILSTEEYLKLNDHQMLTLINEFISEKDDVLSKLSKMLVNRKLFKATTKENYNDFLKQCSEKDIDGKFFSSKFSSNVFAYKSYAMESSQAIVIKTENNELKLLEQYSSIAKILQTLKKKKITYFIYPEVLHD